MPATTFAELFGAVFSAESLTSPSAGSYGPTGVEFTGTLVVGSGEGSGDATLANQQSILSQLDTIQAAIPVISPDTPIEIVSNVRNGSEIVLYLGDDYVGDKAITIEVSDVSGALRTFLQSIAVDSVVFAAGKGIGKSSFNAITGTVDPAVITNSGGVSTIQIEITSAQSANAEPCTKYTWHIKAIDTDGNESVEVEGKITAQPERAKIGA